ncbi:DUF1194 domain-containing protein [Alteromonas sp. 1_MG-2023]|uniref:DUF1194 domain-containing protein n=1 Tax=Alteromonas sp. 1_MG-2023 TaxID=3062669 RepID=UPI0026E3B990|nr:DUF1194 domain-containing protein [Alteromonas sp. 1_MG-2023]MDO6566380.1 DUF1194 domain-containing protein [Alteromonas sp. 1_MG-2023]
MNALLKKGIATAALVVALASPAQAALIDIELSLVIDVSGSVDTNEYNLQMDGYAQAFRDASVIQNIENSTHGIAVNAVFFASNYYNTVLDAFTVLQTAADATNFANILDTFIRPGSGGTVISSGIDRAVELLLANDLDATVGTVIDVSGDGTSFYDNTVSRDAAVAEGFTINGIAIGGDTITDYYRDNVIGGTDAFVIEATTFEDFENGIISKLQIETQTAPAPTPVPAPAGVAIMLLAGMGLILSRKLKR